MKYILDNLCIANSTSLFSIFLILFVAFLRPFSSLFSHSCFPGMTPREKRNNALILLCKKNPQKPIGSKVIPVTTHGGLPVAGMKMQILKSSTTRHLAMVARAHSLSTFSQSQHNFKLFNIQLKSFECLLEEFSPIHSPP